MRVAAIQMRSSTRPDDNVAALRETVAQAAAQKAIYVQTPEMTGLIQKDPKALFAAIKPQESDPVFAAAAELARTHRIWLHIGSTPIDLGNGKAANRAALFAPDGTLTATYDKIHMFDVDLDNGESWRESAIYSPGQTCRTHDIEGASLGFGICYDVRFPHLFRAQALAGAQILTVPAAFTAQTGRAHWHVLLRARAIENGAFVIAAAQVGKHEDGRETYGHSLVVDPWGEVLLDMGGEEPGLGFCDIDLNRIEEVRSQIPSLANKRDIPKYEAS
ncbi:MAG: carbon-nitrogen hydrolase family protein [Pseudomonadota bacterium]